MHLAASLSIFRYYCSDVWLHCVHLYCEDGQHHQHDLHVLLHAEEHAWDKDMDIERYLQSTEDEIEEEEEQPEEDASPEGSVSKKHRHIGEQTSLMHRQIHSLGSSRVCM